MPANTAHSSTPPTAATQIAAGLLVWVKTPKLGIFSAGSLSDTSTTSGSIVGESTTAASAFAASAAGGAARLRDGTLNMFTVEVTGPSPIDADVVALSVVLSAR